MGKSQFDRVQHLFLTALELPAEQRESWLHQQCGDDQSLLEEIRSLLEHDSPQCDPLEKRLVEAIADADGIANHEFEGDDAGYGELPSIASSSLQLSPGQFCQRLVDSELMDEEHVRGLRDRISADDARSFAEQIVANKKLTPFQATVLLEGRDIPLVLDRYVLLGEIGKGGMGAVYKALHRQMERVVALKILPKESVNSPEKVKRFQREVKAAAKLTHHNIVVAHDATESNGTYFLVMELVAGSDLSDIVRKQGPVSCAQAVDYIAQAARGLEYAHGMGVIHRDIKPGNLLLDKKGKVKILDMGLARIDCSDPKHGNNVSMELTQPGMVMGTIDYLAPEQALDTRQADARSDIYSLGCTLYYLLTGRTVYTEDTIMKTIMAHREGAIPSVRHVRDNVTVELDEIFQKMVAKHAEDRFQSMAEVISALEVLDIEEEEGLQPVVAGSQAFQDTARLIDTSRDVIEAVASGRGKPPKRRWPLIAAGMCGLAVVLAGLVIKLQAPAGTVILEIDQPELIGAVVTIDGEKKVTIQTGEGKEPIEITPDEKRHLLEVKIAGYKTFSEEFSFETGNKQTIKVHLEPLKSQIAEAKPAPKSDYKRPKDQPVPAQEVRDNALVSEHSSVASEVTPDAQFESSQSSRERYELSFDGQRSFVRIQDFSFAGDYPITLEAVVTPASTSSVLQSVVANCEHGGVALGLQSSRWVAYWGYPSSARDGSNYVAARSPTNAVLGHRVHVAAVFGSTHVALFVDGEEVDTAPLVEHMATPLNFYVGADPSPANRPHQFFKGTIEKVRISRGAKFSSDFSPPNQFHPDANTLVLYQMNEGKGNLVKDDSGNGRHGWMENAVWNPLPAIEVGEGD